MTRGARASQRIALWLPAIATVLLAARLYAYVDRYAVPVLYVDQWDLWDGVFRGADPWTLWRWQHGPHRQGLGQWVVAATARLSGWNPRADGFVAASILVLAAVAALALARSLRGRWSPADVAIPFVVLTLWQYEVLVGAVNPSHGPLPLLLTLLLGLAVQARHSRGSALAIAVVGVVASHTGFAFFLAPFAAAVLAARIAGAVRDGEGVAWQVGALLAVLGAIALFFVGYAFRPAVACFRFPDPDPSRYLAFLLVLFFPRYDPGAGGWLQVAWATAGASAVLLCTALAAWGAWRTFASGARDRLASVAFVLAGFTAVFAANTAVGRACLGPAAARAQRYVPYLVPFLVAVYLVLSLRVSRPAVRRVALGLFVAAAVGKEVVFAPAARQGGEHYRDVKQAFLSCFRATGDADACSSGWPDRPDPKATRMQERMEWMRARGLGPFRER